MNIENINFQSYLVLFQMRDSMENQMTWESSKSIVNTIFALYLRWPVIDRGSPTRVLRDYWNHVNDKATGFFSNSTIASFESSSDKTVIDMLRFSVNIQSSLCINRTIARLTGLWRALWEIMRKKSSMLYIVLLDWLVTAASEYDNTINFHFAR
jgi:hypothetical protein